MCVASNNNFPEIVPAILTGDESDFHKMIETVKSFAPSFQIDFMDGKFVPSKSVPVEYVGDKNFSEHYVEAHLMVYKPEEHFGILKKADIDRVIVHYESVEDVGRIIKDAAKEKLEIGLAINPDTSFSEITSFLKDISSVLFMTVYPGYYGRAMAKSVLNEIKKFKRAYPNIVTAVDGGVKLENLNEILTTGVEKICVGSAIMKAKAPKLEYKKFVDRAEEFCGGKSGKESIQ